MIDLQAALTAYLTALDRHAAGLAAWARACVEELEAGPGVPVSDDGWRAGLERHQSEAAFAQAAADFDKARFVAMADVVSSRLKS